MTKYDYGEQMPLRILDEIEFWKRQESEHTVVIREIIPDLEEEFVRSLAEFQRIFAETEAAAVKYIEAVIRSGDRPSPRLLGEICEFTELAVEQSYCFVSFLHRLLNESEAVRGNQVAIVVINHILRESQYFIGIIESTEPYPA